MPIKDHINLDKMKKDGERYDEVFKQMELLGIQDITTSRQHKNGTVVWRLPIKNINNRKRSYIEVASMSTGYVRNQNSGYSNYQLNKRCETDTQYYPESEWVDGEYKKTGKFLPFSCRGCIMIPNEIDRLEYLISYCLKNYYIKRANEVADGKYVSQWYHDWSLERANETYSENTGAMARINDMEEKLDAMTEDRDCKSDRIHGLENKLSNAISPTKYQCVINKLHDLENKLATINRISE
jgi:hypothetical protein